MRIDGFSDLRFGPFFRRRWHRARRSASPPDPRRGAGRGRVFTVHPLGASPTDRLPARVDCPRSTEDMHRIAAERVVETLALEGENARRAARLIGGNAALVRHTLEIPLALARVGQAIGVEEGADEQVGLLLVIGAIGAELGPTDLLPVDLPRRIEAA